MTIEEVAQQFSDLADYRPADFEEMAEAVFRFQVARNHVYKRFVGDVPPWEGWRSAPALPIAAFKLAAVTAFDPDDAERVFESSGTGGTTPSRHFVRSLDLYDRSLLTHFERVFGPEPRIILGHLPRYSERGERSSLVYMVERLIEQYGADGSGFFLDDLTALHRAIASGRPILLFGAAFGLLDLLDAGEMPLPDGSIIIETGGMKTHRRAIGRDELHRRLSGGFAVPRSRVFSEYGMAELLSQCYSRGGEVFYPPPWIRFRIADPEDPMRDVPDGSPGALHVFDLANIHTVSAIATQDLAVRRGDGFEVLGRMSGAELRGCNFLLEADA